MSNSNYTINTLFYFRKKAHVLWDFIKHATTPKAARAE